MTEHTMKRKMRRLTLGMIIIFLVLCAAASGVLGYLYQSMQQTTQIQLQAETKEYKKRILKQLDYNFQCLRTAASMLSYEELDDREYILQVLRSANSSNDFTNMAVFYPDGTGVVTRSDTDTPENYPLSSLQVDAVNSVKQALAGEENLSHLFTDATFRDDPDGTLCVYSVPVFRDNQVVAALTACDNIEIFEEILSGDTVMGGQGYIHLFNDEGDFLIRSAYSVIEEEPETVYDDRFISEEAQEIIREAIAAGKSAATSFVYEGRNYQLYIEPVGVNNWYLFSADTDMSTALYLRHILTVAAVALSLVVLVAVTILYVSYISFRRTSRTLMRLAYYDSVTGAENAERFEERLAERREQRLPYSIAALNIHRFKFINEIHGSAGGDQVLRSLKEVIEAHLREGEFFCRDAADLFYLLLEDTEMDVLYRRLERLMDDACDAASVELALYCGVSVGGERMQALLAMQSIQSSMQKKISFYDAQVHAEERRKSEIEGQMYAALDREDFQLFLQPKVDLSTGKLNSAEALVRWRKPDGTYRFPNEFIPLFEANGFCTQLDLYMVEQVCRQQRKWMDEGKKPIPISVNQTRLLFFSPDYVEKLMLLVDAYRVPPQLLTLEILEGVAIGNVESLNRVIDQLHQKGFRVSMDDFGSGYSSLNALYQLKIDELKLDRGFLAMASNEEDAARRRAILDQIIQFAKTMGLATVAEGVETAEDEALLQELHCDIGQGYYYSKPIDTTTFDEKFMDGLL